MARKVSCLNCGYLCFEIAENVFVGESHPFGISGTAIPHYHSKTLEIEISLQERQNYANWRERQANAICYRQLPYVESKKKWTPHSRISKDFKDILTRAHDCKFYTAYAPGYKPEQHLEIQRSRERRRFLLFTSLISAAVGAGIALLANMVYTAR